jgi:hypothetical protein
VAAGLNRALAGAQPAGAQQALKEAFETIETFEYVYRQTTGSNVDRARCAGTPYLHGLIRGPLNAGIQGPGDPSSVTIRQNSANVAICNVANGVQRHEGVWSRAATPFVLGGHRVTWSLGARPWAGITLHLGRVTDLPPSPAA